MLRPHGLRIVGALSSYLGDLVHELVTALPAVATGTRLGDYLVSRGKVRPRSLGWKRGLICGAACRNRTGDLFITSEQGARTAAPPHAPHQQERHH